MGGLDPEREERQGEYAAPGTLSGLPVPSGRFTAGDPEIFGKLATPAQQYCAGSLAGP